MTEWLLNRDVAVQNPALKQQAALVASRQTPVQLLGHVCN